MRRRRPRRAREAKEARFALTRAAWAAALPPDPRAEFERLLDLSDRLMEVGWALRRGAFALAKTHRGDAA